VKRRYRVKVSTEGNVEETQFVPQADSSPRIRTRYVRDPEAHGKYRDGVDYSIDPERVEDEPEEALASEDPAVEAQREQERAEARKARKRR